MDKNMIKRLAAVMAEQAERETGEYAFFKMLITPGGDFEAFYGIQTNSRLGWDEFFREVEENPDTVYVFLQSEGDDPRRDAYWAELEANAPSWADLQRENAEGEAHLAAGTYEEYLAAQRAEEEAKAAAPQTERALLAAEYAAQLEAWDAFFGEMRGRQAALLSLPGAGR